MWSYATRKAASKSIGPTNARAPSGEARIGNRVPTARQAPPKTQQRQRRMKYSMCDDDDGDDDEGGAADGDDGDDDEGADVSAVKCNAT